MSKNLNTQWRVEWRLSKKHKWRKGGLYETRSVAREKAAEVRDGEYVGGGFLTCGVGFGNTRVVKYVKGTK